MSTAQRSPEPKSPSTALRLALGVVALIVFGYSLLIATRPLLGAMFVVWLLGLDLLLRFFHLTSRFVRAVERIADALERDDGDALTRRDDTRTRRDSDTRERRDDGF